MRYRTGTEEIQVRPIGVHSRCLEFVHSQCLEFDTVHSERNLACSCRRARPQGIQHAQHSRLPSSIASQ